MIFLVTCCAATLLGSAQTQKKVHHKVPESVRTSYQNDYPDYKDVHTTWDMQNNHWHTRYRDKDHNNRYVDVYYDKDGHRMESRSQWNRNDLPEPVKDHMWKKYHTHSYKAYRIDKPSKGAYFQITWGNKKVYLDESGNEVKY